MNFLKTFSVEKPFSKTFSINKRFSKTFSIEKPFLRIFSDTFLNSVVEGGGERRHARFMAILPEAAASVLQPFRRWHWRRWQGTLGVRDDHCRVRVRRRVLYFFSSWNTRMTHIHSSSL